MTHDWKIKKQKFFLFAKQKFTYIHTYTYTSFQHGRIISTRIKYTNLNIYNVSQKIKIIITVSHDCRARVHILSIL